MLSSPRSEAEFTARSSTVEVTVPFTTRLTLPEAFSATRKSLADRKAM